MTHPLIKEALVQTAARIVAGGSFRESLVEDALEIALGERFGSDHVATCGRQTFQIPDWDPCPLGIDMVVRHRRGHELRFVFELKVDDVDQTSWDIY
jgi:hypothetical protein